MLDGFLVIGVEQRLIGGADGFAGEDFFLHKGDGSQVAGIVPLVEQDTIPDNLQVLKLKRV